MTSAFNRLRLQGVFATLQTLADEYRVTLARTGCEPSWGAGKTAELALAVALAEWGKRNPKVSIQ